MLFFQFDIMESHAAVFFCISSIFGISAIFLYVFQFLSSLPVQISVYSSPYLSDPLPLFLFFALPNSLNRLYSFFIF